MSLFAKREITWRTEQRRIGDMVDWEKNPRDMTEKQGADLELSLRKFGYVEEIVVNADGRSIIGGHMRRKVLLAQALLDPDAMVDVRIPSCELNEGQREELAIRLNQNRGQWDFDGLANHFELPKLLDWGFEERDFGLGGASPLDDDDKGKGFADGSQFQDGGHAAIIPLTDEQANDPVLKEALTEWCGERELVYQIKRA